MLVTRTMLVLAAAALAAPTALASSTDTVVKVGEGDCEGDYTLCLCEDVGLWVGLNMPRVSGTWPPPMPPDWSVEWEDPVVAAGPCG